MPFEPVKDHELQVGKPVPWSLYDEAQNLLMARGVVIESASQLEQLRLRGLFRKLHLGAPLKSDGTEQRAEAQREQWKPLEDIGLTIGDTLHLQSQAAGSATRHAVRLIGFLRGKGLIVTTPTQDGKVLLMREGQSFVVRFFSGKSIYAFSTSIFKVANVPYPHLHLTYPNQVKGLIVRRGARAGVRLIAAVQDANGTSAAASLEDLSTGGCSLTAKCVLGESGERIQIKFRVSINEVEHYLDTCGIIRSVNWDTTQIGDGPQPRHGVQFVDLTPNDQIALTAFVYHALHESTAGA